MTDEPLRRRSTDREIAQIDQRLGFIERDFKQVTDRQLPAIEKKLDVIGEAMADPDRSPLGKQLIDRAVRNAENIKALDLRLDAQEKRSNQQDGVANFFRVVQGLLAIAVAMLVLYQFFGPNA